MACEQFYEFFNSSIERDDELQSPSNLTNTNLKKTFSNWQRKTLKDNLIRYEQFTHASKKFFTSPAINRLKMWTNNTSNFKLEGKQIRWTFARYERWAIMDESFVVATNEFSADYITRRNREKLVLLSEVLQYSPGAITTLQTPTRQHKGAHWLVKRSSSENNGVLTQSEHDNEFQF